MPNRDEDVVNDTLNLWQGFAVAARKPDGKSGAAGCQLFLDHGLKIICSGNEAHYDYLIKREAFIAQKRIRSEIALGLRTEAEGTGKGAWCRPINRLYGVHAMQVQKPEHVIGKHNPHLEKVLRLTADEALFAGNPQHRNALYALITEPTVTVEPKFVDAYTTVNLSTSISSATRSTSCPSRGTHGDSSFRLCHQIAPTTTNISFKTRDNERALADAEQAAWRAQDALDQIHAAPSLKERRRLARKLGPTIVQLGEAMRLSNALLEEQHERHFLNMFTQLLVDRAFAELRGLCGWKLPDKPTGSARRSVRQGA